jgi:hypothetical protein
MLVTRMGPGIYTTGIFAACSLHRRAGAGLFVACFPHCRLICGLVSTSLAYLLSGVYTAGLFYVHPHMSFEMATFILLSYSFVFLQLFF